MANKLSVKKKKKKKNPGEITDYSYLFNRLLTTATYFAV